MEKNSNRLMTPFDCHTTPHWLYTLKLLLPYTPVQMQYSLGILIRLQEMQYTMKNFRTFPSCQSTSDLLSNLKPYMDSSELEMMEQVETMMSMVELMQTVMPTDEMDSSEMFHLYNNMFGNMKGDTSHE